MGIVCSGVLYLQDGEGPHADRPGVALPKYWTADRDRCKVSVVSEDVDFGHETGSGGEDVGARSLPARWVTADEAYGGNRRSGAGSKDGGSGI